MLRCDPEEYETNLEILEMFAQVHSAWGNINNSLVFTASNRNPFNISDVYLYKNHKNGSVRECWNFQKIARFNSFHTCADDNMTVTIHTWTSKIKTLKLSTFINLNQ